MANFNTYPPPVLPLTGTEQLVIAQVQNGNAQPQTCTVTVTQLFGGGESGGTIGPSSARPSHPTGGQFFFDTTLNQPVWWNGGSWTNAAGASV